MLGKDAFFTEFWNELEEVADQERPRGPYVGIVGTRVNCVNFHKLMDVREFWIDMYYGDDEKPDGWDIDDEEEVYGIDEEPEWVGADSE
jgi:hypothetical protein|eukprot:COSAG06_NODE_2509_length_6742_cov_3.061418_2_plen_89_part_00